MARRFIGLKAFALALVGLASAVSMGFGKTADPIAALIAEKTATAPILAPSAKRGVVLTFVRAHLTEADLKAEIDCMARNVFHEARGESLEGQMAVVAVTLNRLKRARWGKTICEVVYAPYQFSWTLEPKAATDKRLDREKDTYRAIRARVKTLMLQGFESPVGSADHYAMNHIRKDWMVGMRKVRTIGCHTFYKA